MKQFEVFVNPSRASRAAFPFVVVLQSEVSAGRTTIIVAPIAPARSLPENDRAGLKVEIDGAPHVVLMQALAAIPQHTLRRAVASLPLLGEQLPRAIDYLFLGL